MRHFGLIPVCLLLALCGCAQTKQARKVEISGFLGDYSQLEKCGKGEALLFYRNPNVDFTSYTKIILDPISVWRDADSKTSELSEEDVQNLGELLHA